MTGATTPPTRTTFATSRLLDFFSEKELTTQTGHPPSQWPLVVLKELVDNALDACEEAPVSPEITVRVDQAGVTVTDNGPGIPADTVAAVLDYTVRVSSREAYVAPDRGAQGNALKTILAMPFVLDGTTGEITLEAQGVRHEIAVSVDPIRQEPVITHHTERTDRQIGTKITILWPDSACSILQEARGRFLQIAEDYAWLNPHLQLRLDWHDETAEWKPTHADWPKWRPCEPTSPHWYGREHLERLVAAYATHEQHAAMTVRELVTKFRGLSGSAKTKRVLDQTGMARTTIADLVNGEIDSAAVERLLASMQEHSMPVKPARLGVIGQEHLTARLAELGCEMDTFRYKKTAGETADGLPYVVEFGFGWCPDLGYRRLVTGVNWSPGIGNPFRAMGRNGASLDTLLERQRVDEDCVMVLHLASPRVTYTDRGKSSVVIR